MFLFPDNAKSYSRSLIRKPEHTSARQEGRHRESGAGSGPNLALQGLQHEPDSTGGGNLRRLRRQDRLADAGNI